MPISVEVPEQSLDFTGLSKRIFTVKGDVFYVGGEPATQQMRELLRDEARYIITSTLWEVFNAAITNEAASMALINSTEWEHVEVAKMLHHWAHFFRNTLYTCAKDTP